jgi:hypothetical protein
MKPERIIFLVLFVCQSLFIYSQQKYSTVKIKAPVKDKMKFSQLIGQLEIDHYYFDNDGDLVAEIGPKELAELKRSGYAHRVVIDDVAQNLRRLVLSKLRQRLADITVMLKWLPQ